MPEAPHRSQKVVSVLKCSVVETLNRTPFCVVGIVQKTAGELCVQVALRNDDPERLPVHIVLLAGDFHVHVIFEKRDDPHLALWRV